jgi:hypothetical protein
LKTLVDEEAQWRSSLGDDPAEDEDDSFDPEKGDEDDADDEDRGEVASDVEDDDDVPAAHENVAAKEKRVRSMPEKKSMSDYVREEIDRRKKSGDSLRGVDIVTELAKHKIKVSPAQVSQLLKKAGVSQKAPGPRKAKLAASQDGEKIRAAESVRKGEATRKGTRIHAPAADGMSVHQFKAAKDFLSACHDCYDEAARVLELHEQLRSTL